MTPERSQKVKEIFQSALVRAPAERSAFLFDACGGDKALRQEVQSLLAAHEKDETFIDSPAYQVVAGSLVAEKPELNVGQTIASYEIISFISRGGMGEVYLAHDTRLGRKVALKLLPAAFTNDKDRLQRFVQEARAASALNHPNIITIYEILEANSVRLIAAEFVEGETLRQRLSEAPPSLAESRHIAIQVADALTAAHKAGITHRDIKPENIMLRPDGYVKVLDFGLAKLTEPRESGSEDATRALVKTEAGVVMGTVAYMSPEQARGLQVDERTDIWSLGVVLHEMLAGELPFAGETKSDVIASILKTEPAPPRHFNEKIPAELERIVSKTLVKDREERYQSARDLLIDLRRLESPNRRQNENATQILTGRPTLGAAFTEGIRKHKLSFAVALSVLLIAAIGLGYWFFSRSAPIESIAVLPFVNESGNSELEYLPDGMTESLINGLSQLPKLSVKARSSVFRYKGKQVDPQQVAAELSVQAILTGRVVQRGEDLTLFLALVDARGNQIWGEQYNRKLTDLLSLQSQIARDVSNKLRVTLSGADKNKVAKDYTANTEAYQLYLRGRFHQSKDMPQELRKAVEYFQQAIALDPNFALAYAGLAYAYAPLSDLSSLQPRELMLKAKEAALHALSLDDQLVEAHTALGYILFEYDYDFARAEREFKRAIELNPNDSDAHRAYGELLTYLGRREDSLAELRRALEIDPLALRANCEYGRSLSFARRYDEAITQLKRTLELDNSYWLTHYNLAITYNMKGDYAESVTERLKIQDLFSKPQTAALMRESFAKGGWQGFLRAMTPKQLPPNVPLYIAATFHVELGEKDKALAILNQMYQDHNYDLVMLKVDPRLDPLRDDPRFQELMRRVGF